MTEKEIFLPILALALAPSQPGDRRMGARGGREEEEVSRLGEEATEDLKDRVKKQVENENDKEDDNDVNNNNYNDCEDDNYDGDKDDDGTMKMTMMTMFTMFSGHLHQGCWRMKSQVPIRSQHLRSSFPSPSPASSSPPPAASQSS